MASVAWTERARDDLRRIHDHFSARNHRAADRLIDRLYAAGTALADFPEIGGVLDDWPGTDARERIVGRYRLIYQYDGSTCRIARVIRGDRDLQRALHPSDFL